MERSDIELIEAMRRGDEDAVGLLLARHSAGVFRFGLKMCRGDREDAEDVVQETLLAAARGLKDFRGASSLTTWLFTIARSFCIKKRRKDRGESVSLDHAAELRSPTAGPDDAVADRELGVALERAIGELEPMYREVLLLRDVEGLAAAQVAEILEISVDAVKSRLHRARTAVRAKVEPLLPRAEHVDAPETAQCPDIVNLFSRYLEGEIGENECQRMEAHVKSCRRCSAGCDSLKHTLALCRATPTGSVPADVQERVRRSLRELGVVRGGTGSSAPPAT